MRDQAGRLWIINYDHVSLLKNVGEGERVFLNPGVIEGLIVCIEFRILRGNRLQHIMKFSFSDVEYFFFGIEHMPVCVDVVQAQKANEGMAHQGNAATLRGCIDEY